MKNRAYNKFGFTLVEMIVTLGVISILVATLVPVISNYLPGVQLNGATRQLTSDLREVQERAITEQNQLLIRFYPAASPTYYQLIRKLSDSEEQLRQVNLPSGATLSLEASIADNQVIFSPDGGPSSSGKITLNIGGKEKKIDVSFAGYIKIE